MSIKVQKPIAHVIILLLLTGSQSIYSQPNREKWQPPEVIMDSIGVKPGMIIGEPGAGRGFFTIPLAKRVGENGRVYANDISKRSLNKLEEKAKTEGLNNIEIVIGELEDPVFPVKNLDMMIMVYVLHDIEKPAKFMKNAQKYIQPGKPLVIIERAREHDDSPPHFFNQEQILKALKQTNFKFVEKKTFLEKDIIYIFQKVE